MVSCFSNFTLAWQEDQNVTGGIACPKFVDSLGNGIVQIVLTCLFKRTPPHLNRKGSARNHDHWRRPLARSKVLRKTIGIDGGRSDHHFEVRSARQDLTQVAQQEVNVQTSLVSFVNDEGVVSFKERVVLCFGQQNTVGHELDRGIL